MHISDAPLSPRKEDFGGGRDGTCRRDAERMPGRGGSAKLKIKWCDLHYKSITLWHLHKVYLCNSTSFSSSSSSLPSSGPPSRRSAAWARINMYKSLFGGKIELHHRQKVWRVHFAGTSSTHNAPGGGRAPRQVKLLLKHRDVKDKHIDGFWAVFIHVLMWACLYTLKWDLWSID